MIKEQWRICGLTKRAADGVGDGRSGLLPRPSGVFLERFPFRRRVSALPPATNASCEL